MYPRFHREFGALLLLALIVLSGMAVLPWTAQAQTRQLNGLVYEFDGDCGVDNTVFVAGATVTLIDANGRANPTSVTTGPAGTYAFTPSPGQYRLRVERSGYYDNGTGAIRFDGTATVREDICLTATPTANKVLVIGVIRASGSTPVVNATVEVVYPPRKEVIATALTNVSGNATFSLWTDTFELRTNKTDFALDLRTVDTATTTKVTIALGTGIVVVGQALDAEGNFISAGLEGYLYDTSAIANPAWKIVNAKVVGSSYTFNVAFGGTYRMVIDANGFRANVSTQDLQPGLARRIDAILERGEREEYRTAVVFEPSDWNNLTVYRNLTLNADTTLPGLNPAGLRNLALQVDFTFGESAGTRDGTAGVAERTDFAVWLDDNGPLYTTTDGFLTVNGKSYISNGASYGVAVVGLDVAGSRVWINASATYTIRPPYLANGAARYFVNVTAIGDTNTSVHQDQSVEIVLPRMYEKVSSIITPANAITTSGFTRVLLDPTVLAASPQARMTVEESESGTARGKVAGPAGRFHVVNASFDGYKAFVANNTTLTLSAEDSTDPVGDIADANFTWRPYANVTGPLNLTKVYGIRAEQTYDRSGEFLVNLTVVEAGGNVTWRNITLWVDDQTPVARMRTNRTGSAAIPNNTTLRVNEDERVRFDGGPSSDLAFANRPEGGNRTGVIRETGGYAWDFDGDRITDATTRVVNWTFVDPGNFTVNLTVTDGVGWESSNATITVLVNDTTVPTPLIDVRDPANEWDLAATLTEKRPYSFNASRTTDNHDDRDALNYTWTIPGPVQDRTGTKHEFYGMNITFTWTEFNSSYRVVLNVTDTGFGSGKENTGTLTRPTTVQIDPAMRPDLRVESTTLKIDPSEATDGGTITVTVNITNRPGRGTATVVTTTLSAIAGGQTTVLTTTATWKNKNGTDRTNGTIAAGETIALVFTAPVTGQGNKTIEVKVSDVNEAWTQVGADNKASKSLFVQPSLITSLIPAIVVGGLLALFVIVFRHRRNVRTGKAEPWRFPRRERVEGEEKKPRKEVKEEKKRL